MDKETAQPEQKPSILSVCEDIQQLCNNGDLSYKFEDVIDWMKKGELPAHLAQKPLTNAQLDSAKAARDKAASALDKAYADWDKAYADRGKANADIKRILKLIKQQNG